MEDFEKKASPENLGDTIKIEPEDISIDELIRSTREEIAHLEELMGTEETPHEDIPAPTQEDKSHFEPVLPREYAELELDEEDDDDDDDVPASFFGRMPLGVKTFLYVTGVLLVSVVAALCGWFVLDDVAALTGEGVTVTFAVGENDTTDSIADRLEEAGLIEYPWLFRLYCNLANADEKIRPGTYELSDLYDYHALVNGMAAVGQRATVEVMIPEGYECRQIFTLLEEKGVCSADKLWDAAANEEFDYDFLVGATLGDPNRLEGCLFPDTYEFYMDDEPRNVLSKFLRNTDRKLTEELYAGLEELNLTLRARKAQNGFTRAEIEAGELSMYDLLNVASLIEKEPANAQEATTIASVIYNRLCSKKYPCLEIDATIQYILEERKETLSQQDTLIDSPYNTYKYPGLPAGAIANPGMTSIRGALFPKDTQYYFYALDKDGTHHFSRTYDEHLAFLWGRG